MCELLGISVSPAAAMGLYLKALRPRAERNTSGWGIGWYEDGRAHVVKEPVRLDESEVAARLSERPPRSDLFVVHVRAATVGALSMENTHPFQARLHGRDWVFAHNGTIRNLERLPVGHYRQSGETDSEVAFHYLLSRLERLGRSAGDEREAAEILAGARELSEDGKCNFLLSDGRTLYAYYDGHKTLHYTTHRAADLGTVEVADDEDYRIRLDVTDAEDERAVVVASVPLTSDERWVEMKPGEFLVCRDGRVASHVAPGAALASR